jgi:cell division protein FtsI/penicillin-binding protein 2
VRPNRSNWRFSILAGVLFALVMVILARTLQHQVFSFGESPSALAIASEPAERGAVVDRNGVPFIVNRHYFQLAATPDLIETDEERIEVATQLDELLGIPAEDTFTTLKFCGEEGLRFCVLADAITAEETQLLQKYIEELETSRGLVPLQHVYAKPMTRRSYPQAELASHLTGFVMVDTGGVTGIEEYYDEFLPADGIGLLRDKTDAIEVLPDDVQRFLPSPAGKDLILTVDRTVQWIIHEELAKGLDEFGAESGTIIVMEPSTGAILGMVSLPDFDPNRFEEEPMERFTNPAISAQYEPGSVFKIITIGAALDAGIVEPSTVFTDTGRITIGDRVIFNSDRVAYGEVTVTGALARSLNVVTSQIAEKLGEDRLYPYIRQFGFGKPTNIDLSGEISGALKTPGNPEWSLSDLATNSFGQGLAVTPLQMANATAAIANGGRMMQPHVVQARIVGDSVQVIEPTAVQQVLSPETAEKLTEMMVEVVETGNVKAAVPGYRVAGKSGTAQIPTPDGYEERATIVSFVGFAPADDPKFVVLVKMDRPDFTINQWASHTAAPVFSRVTERLLQYYSIPPEEPEPTPEAVVADPGADIGSTENLVDEAPDDRSALPRGDDSGQLTPNQEQSDAGRQGRQVWQQSEGDTSTGDAANDVSTGGD